MNLDKLLSEGDVSAFEKMNDENIYSVSEFNIDSMNASVDKKASKKEIIAKENKKLCFRTAKRLQSFGKTANEIKSYIDDRFPAEFIPENLEDNLIKEEGIVGVVLVDCSAFDTKNDYDKLPPSIKNHHQFAIKCGCENKYSFKKSCSSKISGDINAFISEQDDFNEMPIATEICPKTGLPVLNKIKDYSDDDAVKYLNELEKEGQITSSEKKNIIATSTSPLNCAKKAFNLILKKSEKQVNAKVDNYNTYSLGKNNNNIQVSKKGKADLDVSDLKTMPITPEVQQHKEEVVVNVPGGKAIPVAVGLPVEKALNINNFQEPKMNINKTDLKKDILVDMKNGIDIPVIIEKEVEIVPDIERGELVDEDWFENKNETIQDIEVDDEFQGFDLDGSSKLMI